MDILRIVARWTGFTGAPGYSSFYSTTDGGFWDGGLLGDEAQAAADTAASDVYQAFYRAAQYLPSDVTIRIDPEAQVINSDTGEILTHVNIDGEVVSGRADSGGYSAASGAVVNWNTSDYRAGRRIRGRTFLVPIAGSAYQDDGTLTGDALDTFRSFGDRIAGDDSNAHFGVWSRPRSGSGGVFASMIGYSVPDMAAVLRSRRD